MSTVTYKAQPAIHKTRGAIELGGNEHPYTVDKVLWPGAIEDWIAERLLGRTLHVCHGKSTLGDVQTDLFEAETDVRADAAYLPFAADSFDTVLCDPPYNGKFRWLHRMLEELPRVARQRVIFQNWYLPVNSKGQMKKAHRFTLTETALWQGRAYFGRAQVLSVMDCKRSEQQSNMLYDDFGNEWSVFCPYCDAEAMQVLRPGKAQCAECGGSA